MTYLGQLTADEVQAAYRKAKIMVVPSTFESFGMVAIEAMQHGCIPVVAGETALVDIVADDELVFARGSREALARRCGH